LRAAGALVTVLAVLAVVACGGEGANPSRETAAAASAPTGPSGAPPSEAPSASAPSGILVDEGLLAALPREVDGITLNAVPDAARQIAADPNLRRDAVGVAVGMLAGLTETSEDFAVASVVELGAGVFDDDFFASWRDSYDESACEPAGGVSRRAETLVDGRAVFVATCVQGARTYHVHLAGPDRIVSITSIGERNLGEQIVTDLEE
jgi:hypothetical protein